MQWPGHCWGASRQIYSETQGPKAELSSGKAVQAGQKGGNQKAVAGEGIVVKELNATEGNHSILGQ